MHVYARYYDIWVWNISVDCGTQTFILCTQCKFIFCLFVHFWKYIPWAVKISIKKILFFIDPKLSVRPLKISANKSASFVQRSTFKLALAASWRHQSHKRATVTRISGAWDSNAISKSNSVPIQATHIKKKKNSLSKNKRFFLLLVASTCGQRHWPFPIHHNRYPSSVANVNLNCNYCLFISTVTFTDCYKFALPNTQKPILFAERKDATGIWRASAYAKWCFCVHVKYTRLLRHFITSFKWYRVELCNLCASNAVVVQ